MSEPLTVEYVGMLFALGSAIGGGIWRIWYKLDQKITKVDSDLSNYKLIVAEKYASITYLKDVEERLVGAINKLERTVHTVPQQIIAAIRGQLKDELGE